MAFLKLLVAILITTAVALPQHGQSPNPSSDNQLGPTNKYFYSKSTYAGYSGQSSVFSGEALNWFKDDSAKGQQAATTEYQCYGGKLESYPPIRQWLSFNDLWKANQDAISRRNSGDQQLVGYIHDAILKVSSESKVDARLILATVMQEVRISPYCWFEPLLTSRNSQKAKPPCPVPGTNGLTPITAASCRAHPAPSPSIPHSPYPEFCR